MAKVELHDSTEPVPEKPVEVSQATGSLLMSLAFWLTLVAAAGMYAAVSLSPKLVQWMMVRQQLTSNALRLQQLENEADYLERVADALKKDPEFAERLVRATQSPALDEVPFDASLTAASNESSEAESPDQGFLMKHPDVYEGVVRLASDVRLRRGLLVSSASMTLIAFTLFNDAGVRFLVHWIATIGRLLKSIVARYRKPPAEEPEPMSAP